MRKRKNTDVDVATGDPGKGGALLPAFVVATGLVVGGYLMQPAPAPAGAAPAPTAVYTEGHPPEGPVVPVEPVTLNLADGHFLKVGVALQLAAAEAGDEAGHGAGDEPALDEGQTAKALDIAISTLSRYTMDELSDPDRREKAQERLAHEVGDAYHGEVVDVFFTDFVMQ